MRVYFVSAEARPGEQLEEFKRVGGAHVNCWIKADTPDEVLEIMRRDIQLHGWILEAIEVEPRLETAPPESAKEYFAQAQIDGSCYVFHTWPITDHNEEPLH